MNRFLPRARLLKRPQTLNTAFAAHWMSDELRRQCATPPALSFNVNWLRLENDENAFLDFDGVPWMPSKVRASALMLGYDIEWIPTSASSWIHTAQSEEQKWRDVLLAQYASRLKELQTELSNENLKEEDKAELRKDAASLENLEAQLKPGGIGFLHNSYGGMGTRTTGVFWALSAPNVPVQFESAFTLARDRAISFRLKRFKAPKEQTKYDWRIEFEGGQTCYALVFGDDGNATQFIHYRSMSPALRAQKRARIETLLDFGRLTPADKKKIIKWEDEERAIHFAAGERERGERALTSAEKVRIAELHRLSEALGQKKLTPAQEKERQKLSNELFLAQESFSLQENANDLLGKEVDVTIQFLRAGYVLVRCGADTFVYENTRVTGAQPHEFHFGLPDKSIAKIYSDGGKWGLVWGRPRWGGNSGKGVLKSTPFTSNEPLDPETATFTIVGDAIGDAVMSGKLIELRAPVVGGAHPQSGLYQIEVSLSGGAYTPEIYSLGFHCAAQIDSGFEEVVWDSTMEVISPLKDVLLQDDKRRSRHAQVIIARPLSQLQMLPQAALGLSCEIDLVDRTNGQVHPFVHFGCVTRGQRARVGRLETISGFGAVDLAGGEWVLDVVGCEGFFNREMQAQVAGDGMWPGDYVRLMCADALLPAHLWSRIPSGEAAHKALGWDRIPPTRPGRYPHFKPKPGTLFWSQIQTTVQNHCPGGAIWNDGQGLRLDKNLVRDRRDIQFGTPATGVPVFSNRCLRNQEGFKLAQDARDYITSATFVGKKNPLTGIRVVGGDSIPQASDPRFEDSAFHIGYDIPFVSEADDSLSNIAACERAARDKLNISPLTPDGLAPWWSDNDFDLDPDLLTGDLVQFFGVNFVIDTLELGALTGANAGRMKASVQLAQDVSMKEFAT